MNARNQVKMRQALKRVYATQGRAAGLQAQRRAQKLASGGADRAVEGQGVDASRAQAQSGRAVAVNQVRFAAGGLAPVRGRRR